MKRFFERLSSPDSPDQIISVLQAWRAWLLGAVVGALLGWGVYAVFPPPYRAQASLILDHNLEQAWVFFPERQLFNFMSREVLKLEAIAFSDDTLQQVADQAGGVSIEELRQEKLLLSHPDDGVWHLWAEDKDPDQAERLASAWAVAFADGVQGAIEIEPGLEAARAELNALYQEAPDTDPESITPMLDEIAFLVEQSKGISPYLEISLTQVEDLPVSRTVRQAVYLLAGSVLGALGFAFGVLLVQGKDE
jgi:hypothetical protein